MPILNEKLEKKLKKKKKRMMIKKSNLCVEKISNLASFKKPERDLNNIITLKYSFVRFSALITFLTILMRIRGTGCHKDSHYTRRIMQLTAI